VQAALQQIEDKANNVAVQDAGVESAESVPQPDTNAVPQKSRGRWQRKMDEIGPQDHAQEFSSRPKSSARAIFDLCLAGRGLTSAVSDVVEPFIYNLAEKNILHVEKSLKLLADKSRTAYLPLDKYDVDIDLMRGFPAEVCRRWCVVPFDRMSKSIFGGHRQSIQSASGEGSV